MDKFISFLESIEPQNPVLVSKVKEAYMLSESAIMENATPRYRLTDYGILKILVDRPETFADQSPTDIDDSAIEYNGSRSNIIRTKVQSRIVIVLVDHSEVIVSNDNGTWSPMRANYVKCSKDGFSATHYRTNHYAEHDFTVEYKFATSEMNIILRLPN